MAGPNIVFILADDMGYGDFSAFNEGRSCTPTLDALIGEGVCFTQQYTASPVCNPSRASLMTGRYPHRTGSIDTLDWRGLDRLALREVTLADALKAAGYATGLVGKWHLGAFDPRFHPNARGFDEFVGFRGGWQRYYKWTIECNDRVKKADGRYLTDVFTDEAVKFIERHKDEPFFLHLAYNAPHTPLEAPDEDVKVFADTGQFNTGLSILYAMIRRMDAGIARVMETLKRLGLERNTLVLFTSDNGPQFSGKGDMSIVRFNCGFNGCKGKVYEGGVRVPALVRWPDGLDCGRQIHEMAHFNDWFSTLLSVAGAERPPDTLPLDGQDILPVLRGERAKVETRRFWQWNRLEPVGACNAAMRDGEWKLVRPEIKECMSFPSEERKWNNMMRDEPEAMSDIIRTPLPPRHVPLPAPPELYNIAEDAEEKHNLAEKYPDRARKMLTELETWFEEVEAERATIKDEA